MPRGDKRQGPGGRAAGSDRDSRRDKREGQSDRKDHSDYSGPGSESSKAEARTSEVGKSRDKEWGSYEGSSMSIGGGTSMHEAYGEAVGKEYGGGRDGQSDRHRSSWSSEKAKEYDYGFDKYEKPVGAELTGEGFWADTWKATKEFFGAEEDWTRSEAWSEYGFQSDEYRENVPMSKRSMSERAVDLARRFQEAPLDTVADIMDNPMINTALAATGLGAIGLGVQAVDKIADMVQGETTIEQGMRDLAATTIESTPIGSELGLAKPVATAALRDIGKVPETVGGLVGGQVGAQTGGRIGTAVAGPIGGAVGAAAGGVMGSHYAREQVRKTPTGAPARGGAAPSRDRRDSRTSPLVSSGEEAIARSEQLRTQDPRATKYVPLPFYGMPQQDPLTYYGMPQQGMYS